MGWSPGRWARWLLGGVVLVVVTLQVLAYRHATVMVRFSPGARRMGPPESLGLTEKLSVLVSGVTLPRLFNDNYSSPLATIRIPHFG